MQPALIKGTHGRSPLSTLGYAVVENGSIDLRSVGPTRVSAAVNWLMTSGKFVVRRGMPDSLVDKIWREHKGSARMARVAVSIDEYDND